MLRVSVTQEVRVNLHRLSSNFLGSQSNHKEMMNLIVSHNLVPQFVEEELLKNVFHPKMWENICVSKYVVSNSFFF
jgi:hypothetical protein